MANIFITEYAQLGHAKGEMLIAPLEPAVTNQQIANPVASTASSAVNAGTAFVMVHVDAAAHLAFGSAPTAVTTAHRLAAGETRFYAVIPGTSMKIAAINGS